MSTGCQSVSQTGRKIYRAPGRQTERQNDSMADSRAAKEPALVSCQNRVKCPESTSSSCELLNSWKENWRVLTIIDKYPLSWPRHISRWKVGDPCLHLLPMPRTKNVKGCLYDPPHGPDFGAKKKTYTSQWMNTVPIIPWHPFAPWAIRIKISPLLGRI